MTVSVEIPESMVALLEGGGDLARKLLEDTAAQAYREGKLTQYELRLALGMQSRFEVDPFLKRYEIYDYTVEDFEEDGAVLAAFRNARAAA